jgi:uncharacterized FlaG/YvyC family protein
MKQSHNFSDVFGDILEEAYSADPRMSGAPGSWRRSTQSKTNSTSKSQGQPFAIYPAKDGHWNADGYSDMNTQSPDETDAPKIFSYELERVNELLVSGYEKLKDAADEIQKAVDSSNPSLTDSMKTELKELVKIIDNSSKETPCILKKIYQIGMKLEQIARLSV